MADPAALNDASVAKPRPPRMLHMSSFTGWGGAVTAMLTLVAELDWLPVKQMAKNFLRPILNRPLTYLSVYMAHA